MVVGEVPKLATHVLKHLSQHANTHAKTDLKCVDDFTKVAFAERSSEP